jgi:hypothetical protein
MKSHKWYNSSMITGVYKVYLDGKCVAEKSNSITKAGRSIILKSIMGLIPTVGGEIGVGISSTPNSKLNADGSTNNEGFITDTSLGFALSSAPVKLSFLDNGDQYDAMVFKGTIGDFLGSGETYKIYELGLFPAIFSTPPEVSRLAPLFSGVQTDQWKEGTTDISSRTFSASSPNSCYITLAEAAANGYSFRIGNNALFVAGGDTINSSIPGVNLIKNFSGDDKVVIAYSKKTGTSPSLTIKFHNNENSYYQKTFSSSDLNSTYGFLSVTIDSLIAGAVNAPVIDAVSYVTLTATSSNVVVDGIRFNDDEQEDVTFGMVSRAVLDTPIEKIPSEVLEIEYYLSFGFNKEVTS